MGAFDIYSNYNRDASFRSLIFGEKLPILETDLNEMQEIQNDHINNVLKSVISNGSVGSGTISFTIILSSSGYPAAGSQMEIHTGTSDLVLSPTYNGTFTGWNGTMTGTPSGTVVIYATTDQGHRGYFLPTGGNDPADRQYF